LQKLPELDNEFHDNELHQPHVVSLFAKIGTVILAAMGIIALFNQTFILASALFFASSIYFISYYLYKKLNNIKLSSAIVLYSLYLLMFYIVYSGGVEKTGPLWIFAVAPISVFLHGLKYGLIDITFFIVIISSIMFIPTDIIAHAEYTIEFKLRLLYSFLTVTAFSALYEYSRERSYRSALRLSEKYQQLANFDPLTKLSNRRGALSLLQQEQVRLSRNKEPFSIILCDVDHFKKVNDQYGHNAGDTVLINIANIFIKNKREQDCIARWGGEEFLFILPQTIASDADIFAKKIQAILQNNVIPYENEKIKITTSMGIEQFNGTQTIDDIINSADNYLYQAKHAGRNQIFPKR